MPDHIAELVREVTKDRNRVICLRCREPYDLLVDDRDGQNDYAEVFDAGDAEEGWPPDIDIIIGAINILNGLEGTLTRPAEIRAAIRRYAVMLTDILEPPAGDSQGRDESGIRCCDCGNGIV